MSSLTRIAAPIVRRSMSTSAPRGRKIEDLSPEVRSLYNKLQKNQEFFQREDGNWVFWKKPIDRVQLALVSVSVALGSLYVFKTAYDKYNGKW